MLIERVNSIIGSRPYHLLLPFTLVWLIKPFYQGARFDWVALGIALPLFFAFYALANAPTLSWSAVGLTCLTLLGATYVPLNPEASGIFAFGAATLAARNSRPRAIWSYLAGINLLLLAQALWFHLNLWTWIGGGLGAVILSQFVLLHARERETNVQLHLAQDEIGRLAKLAERDRITRDLHDVLGHTLSLIAMKSELAQKRFDSDPRATLAEMQQIEAISREALIRVREAIHGYAAISFAEEANRVAAALGSLGLTVQCNLDDVGMTSMQESVFAMVLQEAATNIIRHAHARSCRIELIGTPEAVQLLVADDGQGARAYDGFGLRGMRERLLLLGGSLQVTADNGTRLQACLPR